jgi:hypothetical protein
MNELHDIGIRDTYVPTYLLFINLHIYYLSIFVPTMYLLPT